VSFYFEEFCISLSPRCLFIAAILTNATWFPAFVQMQQGQVSITYILPSRDAKFGLRNSSNRVALSELCVGFCRNRRASWVF